MFNQQADLPPLHGGASRFYQTKVASRILAVDDDRTALIFLEQELADLGYDVSCVSGGHEALQYLSGAQKLPDVIVLDKIMPDMNGLQVVSALKNDPTLCDIPVVMLTGDRNPDEIREGVDAGVFYYLTKPLEPSLLASVLNSALRDAAQKNALSSELQQQGVGFKLIDTCRFRYRTIDEAWDLAGFMANCFSDPQRVLPGLAELLINAVEHGNLEIGFDAKAELVRTGQLQQEIEHRLARPEYTNRYVDALITHRNGGVCAIITDMGKGFDWKSYLQIDPSRASDGTGRGIAKAYTGCFEKVTYNKAGNQVVAFLSDASALDW